MTSPNHSPVELWYSHRGGATATGLAVQKGWLQEAFAGGDTDLRALEDAASRDIRLAHYHHGQTGLVREGGNIAAIWARSEGQSAVVIGITWVDEYQGILVRRDSGIRTLADLRGRRLGLPLRRRALIDLQRASAQRGFVTALELAGLDPRQAKWIHIERPDFEFPQRLTARDLELDALRSGQVDAIFLRGAQGYAAAQDPAVYELADLNQQEDPLKRVNHGTPRPITVDRAFLDRHPEIVRRYLSVLVKGARWAATHGDEVPTLIAADVPGYSAAEVLGAHGPQLHRSLLPSLRPSYVAGLAEQKRFLLEWRYIDHDFDIDQWIDPAPLADVLRIHHPDSHAGTPHAARWNIPKEQPRVR
jgi:ABC-type nitrate/sulfonate/bicarbonate transport system substrate-binding protein